MPKKSVIVTPVYRSYISKEEEASIVFAKKHLTAYTKIIISPQKLSSDRKFLEFWKRHDYSIMFFDNSYFDGIAAYNRLMLSVDFYKRFVDYEYILLYQLDALILSDTLDSWLTKGYDYVGAPWIAEGKKLRLDMVGNGGLSLRRVKTFIKVLESSDFFFTPHKFTNTSVRPGVKYLLLIKFLFFIDTLFKGLNKRALFLLPSKTTFLFLYPSILSLLFANGYHTYIDV